MPLKGVGDVVTRLTITVAPRRRDPTLGASNRFRKPLLNIMISKHPSAPWILHGLARPSALGLGGIPQAGSPLATFPGSPAWSLLRIRQGWRSIVWLGFTAVHGDTSSTMSPWCPFQNFLRSCLTERFC